MPQRLPLVGQVAGQPILAEENIEEYVQVPAIAGAEGEYVLRGHGGEHARCGHPPG